MRGRWDTRPSRHRGRRGERIAMSTPSFRLDEKPALVTGAGSGIGRRIALGLAEFGAPVGCLDAKDDGLGEVVAEIEKAGGEAVAINADVRDAAALDAAV